MSGAPFVEHRSDVEKGTTRALRFPIRVPLRYRPASEGDWREGEIENISRSGVLFRAEQPLELLTPLEMSLVLPVRIAGQAAVGIVCRGHVVRVAAHRSQDCRAVVAATIVKYRFVRA